MKQFKSIRDLLKPNDIQEQEFVDPAQPAMREPVPVEQGQPLAEPPLKNVIQEPVREMPPDEVEAELAANPGVKQLSEEEIMAELMKYIR